MSDLLVFHMGKFAARFPTDRQYAKNHMWALATETGYRFGLSAYAVRLLQDVYFLDWTVDAGTQLKAGQTIGCIESEKAESDLFAPIAGRLRCINTEVLADPAQINIDTYGAGWLFEIDGAGDELLSPSQYLEHLTYAWSLAQKTIKGQVNQ